MRLVSADSHGKETVPGVGWYGEGEERQSKIQIYTQLEEAEKKEKRKEKKMKKEEKKTLEWAWQCLEEFLKHWTRQKQINGLAPHLIFHSLTFNCCLSVGL